VVNDSTIDVRNRLFVALDLPDPLRDHAAAVAAVASAQTEARVVPAANLHVTLQFLGQVRPERTQDLVAALADAFSGPLIRVRAGAVVARPSPGRARLLALELEDVDGALTVLARRVHRATGIALGDDASNRPLWPHITVARFRRPERVRRSPTTRGERVFDITRVALYHSAIAPGRPPRYHELLGATLGTLAQRSPSNG
jgi:2'-5' RNA ligase